MSEENLVCKLGISLACYNINQDCAYFKKSNTCKRCNAVNYNHHGDVKQKFKQYHNTEEAKTKRKEWYEKHPDKLKTIAKTA